MLDAGRDIVSGSQSAETDSRKLRIFISYSRDDLDFADQLDAALRTCGYECTLDRHGISGGEDWQRRLGNLVRESDTVVFILSPASVRSDMCGWEVEEAARLGKRILPVLCRPLDGIEPPRRLRDLNYVHFFAAPKIPGSGFGTGLSGLVTALNTDLDWLRDHTRYLQRATEWDNKGREANRLLSGSDISEAKAWIARRPKAAPEPTTLQLDYIYASERAEAARDNTERQRLEIVAAAQTERAAALKQAEQALRGEAEAQRQRARLRNITLAVVLGFALLSSALSVLAVRQSLVAEEQRKAAVEQRKEADRQKLNAEDQRKVANGMADDVTTLILKLEKKYGFDAADNKNQASIYQRGAAMGLPYAINNLAVLYELGHGVPKDPAKAAELYEQASHKGYALAMRNLGNLYYAGNGIPKDFGKAREWFEKAVANGETSAMADVALLYDEG